MWHVFKFIFDIHFLLNPFSIFPYRGNWGNIKFSDHSTANTSLSDIQRAVQKVHIGTAISSIQLDATELSDLVEIGFPAEKVTLVTSGDLVAQVTPKIGNANANIAIAASGTASTTITSNMFSALQITRTSGEGKVIILAK